MGTLIAKIKNENQWAMICDQIEIDELEQLDLSDSMVYDPNNNVAHQWFRIENLRNTEYFNDLFGNPIESGELVTINVNQLDDIKYFAYYAEGKFYIQRMLTGCYIRKAGFWTIGNSIQFSNDNKMVTINPIPDGIYDLNTDTLYFQELNRLYNIFSCIKNEYVQGTSSSIHEFLSNDMISLSDDFSEDKVSLSNRKRIFEVARVYNTYSDAQKEELKSYICRYSDGGLEYNEQDGKFKINNDIDLRLLLFGMQMRFYKQPLSNDVQVATSSTSIQNLK